MIVRELLKGCEAVSPVVTDYYCVNLILWEDGFCALSHESCIGARVRETARSDFLYRVPARVFESARYKVGREL